tara:strand:+ start:13959 stop:15149 length:1191 start_codon:yes stop_codon:yes gene_type:complete
MWRKSPLKRHYDVIIVGAGVHGLATAYYLGKLGITNVAVLDKGYIGGGASARSTAILRANYLTSQGIPFFRESLKLYGDLAQELDYNMLFTRSGRFDLGHTESAVFGLRMRSQFNQMHGVDSRLIGPDEIKKLIPVLDIRQGKHLPVMAALYHPPGGVIRHDAVVWGYARGADRMGTEIHPFTEVIGIKKNDNKIIGVETTHGFISAGSVVSATAGWSSTVAALADVNLPIVTHPLQAFVTEPLKPYIDATISSANLHVYAYQTDRGEVVIGGGVNHYPSYSQRSTLDMLETLSGHVLELLPALRDVNVMRQWAGLCDMTPDYAPIMGKVDGLDDFFISCGWGTWGFKAAPIAGKCMAEMIFTGRVPELIQPFSLSRFREGKLVNERASAPAGAIH